MIIKRIKYILICEFYRSIKKYYWRIQDFKKMEKYNIMLNEFKRNFG